MKKIIFVILAILIVGMFIGCASTSGTPAPKNKITYSENTTLEEKFWNRWSLDDLMSNYEPKIYDFDEEQAYKMMKEKFFNILNASEISTYDYYVLKYIIRECEKEHYNNRGLCKKYGTPDDWLADFLRDKTIIQDASFSGTITNTSDEVLRIRLMTRYKEKHCYYFEIPPKEERAFTIPNVSGESAFSIGHPKYSPIIAIGIQSPKIDNTFVKLMQYLLSNYNIEYTYDENEIFELNGYEWSKNWKLVTKSIQGEILSEVDYTFAEQIWKKYHYYR